MILKLTKALTLICIIFVTGLFGQAVRKAESPETNLEKAYKILTEKPLWLFSDFELCPFELFPKTVSEDKFFPDSCDKDATVCLDDCKNNKGMSCYTLAILMQEKKTPFQDYSEALFLRSCKLGVISGCTNRAARILNDKPKDEKTLKCAVDTFEKTCEKDDPWGCSMFGYALHMGISRPKDDDKALKALSKSCKFGETDPACQRAKELTEEIKSSRTVY